MAASHEQPDDASRHEQNGEDEDQSIDQESRLGVHVDDVRKRSEHERADNGRRDELASAEQRHRDDRERLVERKIIGIDIADVERIQAACHGGADIAGDERHELVAEHVDAERVGERVVQANRREAASHPRMNDPRIREYRGDDGREAQVIPHDRPGDRDDAATRHPQRRCQGEIDAERAVREAVPVEDHEPDELGKRERDDSEIELAQLEPEADRADRDRDQRDEQHADQRAHPERNAQVNHRQVRRVRGEAERGRMEQRELPGEAEDQVEADRENADEVREDQDREHHVVVDSERHEEQRYGEQKLHRGAKSPAGRKSRISTRNTSPYASLYAEGRKIDPTPSATPMMMPPANDPITLPMPARIAASTPLRMYELPISGVIE